MRAVLEKSLEKAVELILSGEPVVVIGDKKRIFQGLIIEAI